MYMREMGSVELLTREGEIEIAKRIEDGLKHMIQAISACPTTIREVLDHADRIRAGTMRIDEVVDGLIDPNAEESVDFRPSPAAVPADEADFDDEEGGDAGGASTVRLEELKRDALAKCDLISAGFERMREAFESHGYNSKPYVQAQAAISEELMSIRFTAKIVEKLVLRRVTYFDGNVETYLHKRAADLPPAVGVLVEFTGSDHAAAHTVALQIAALKAKYLTRDEVPADVVAAEKRVAEETAKAEGKPEAALPKIIEGRVNGFFKDVVLLDQPSVSDNKKTVKALLDEAGVTVTRFARFEVGQA
jgi:hypothetical protein